MAQHNEDSTIVKWVIIGIMGTYLIVYTASLLEKYFQCN